jgi:hypothetical protein
MLEFTAGVYQSVVLPKRRRKRARGLRRVPMRQPITELAADRTQAAKINAPEQEICQNSARMSARKLLLARRGLPVLLILALLAWAATMLIWAPGLISTDAGNQLAQARSLQLSDDHPVMMALIWHVTDRVLPGPIGLLLLVSGMYWAGLALFFSALEGPFVARVIGLLAVGFFPPGFINMPVICKDSMMQAGLVAAIGFLVLPKARWRAVPYALAGVMFIIAIGVRHNGATAVWPFIALPLLALPVLSRKPRWLRLLAASVASLLLTFALTVGVDRSLRPLSKKTDFWQLIPVFDLAGMSVRTGELLVEPETGVLAPGLGLDHIRSFYQSSYVNRLYYCMRVAKKRCVPLFRRTQDPKQLAALKDNWLRAIVAHPAAYLEHRLAVFDAMIGLEGGAPGAFYYTGKPHHALAKPYPPRPMTAKTYDWFDRQVPTLWFRPWLYLVLGVALFPLTLWHYLRRGAALPLLFVLSGLSYMLGLFITTGSAPYRYTVWTTFSVVLALVTLLTPLLSKWRRRQPGSSRAVPGGAEPAGDPA